MESLKSYLGKCCFLQEDLSLYNPLISKYFGKTKNRKEKKVGVSFKNTMEAESQWGWRQWRMRQLLESIEVFFEMAKRVLYARYGPQTF